VRPDREDAFRDWLARHWTTLSDLALVTAEPPTQYRFADEPTFIEIFWWRDGGVEAAHTNSRVQQLWADVEPLLEERGGLPKWEFPDLISLRSTP
jgi:hypothetical protein